MSRLVIDTRDPAAFARMRSLTVGEFREFLLADATAGEALSGLK